MAIDPGDLTADDTPATDQQQQQQQQPPHTLESLQAEMRALRTENAKHRTTNRSLRALLSTVSGEEVPEGRPAPDLATLQQRFEKMTSGDRATIRSLKIQKALIGVSHKRGIEDPDYLEYQLGKAGQLNELDPDSEGFVEDLSDRVAELLATRPELRGQPTNFPPGGTGAQFRPTEPRLQLTRESLAAMTPEEVVDAKNSGLLDRMLGRG